MNKSGEAVYEVLRYYKAAATDIIVIYDDIDLETGKLKIKAKGGSGGHKGCASIISSTGTEDFVRIRVGIGRPPSGNDVVEYVLSGFTPLEISIIEEAVESAADGVRMILNNDLSGAMNKYN